MYISIRVPVIRDIWIMSDMGYHMIIIDWDADKITQESWETWQKTFLNVIRVNYRMYLGH